MSSLVPDGWSKSPTGKFLKFRRGTTYVASELSEDAYRHPLYITMKSFKVGGGYSVRGDKYYSPSYNAKQAVENDEILLANTDVTSSCDILGAPLLVPNEKLIVDVLFSHHVTAAKIVDSNVDKNFLFYLFCSPAVRQVIKSCGRGTTVKMLDMKDIGKLSFSIPPLPEQKKIASILTSVDEVIENTQKQIDKLQDLKKATMNELLTKGIGHTEFKDSELGRIPMSWEVVSLGSFVLDQKNGASLSPSDFCEDGFGVIPKKAVQFGGRIVLGDKLTFCTNEFADNNRKNIVNNEYVIAVLRDLVPSGPSIGLIGMLIEDAEFILAQGVYGYLLDSRLNPLFLSLISNTDRYRGIMRKIFVGSTQIHIRSTEFLEVLIPIPPVEEQNDIAERINTMETQILLKQEIKHKFSSLKNSLMQDLLTGKVRVNP